MNLQEKLQAELKQALKNQQEAKVQVLRLLLAQIKNAGIEKKAPLTDEEVLNLLQRQKKQNLEAIDLYRQGGRQDLVDKEEAEKQIIESFLPKELPEEDLEKIVDQIIAKVEGNDFGRIMGEVMKEIKGRADGKAVAAMVKSKLKNRF